MLELAIILALLCFVTCIIFIWDVFDIDKYKWSDYFIVVICIFAFICLYIFIREFSSNDRYIMNTTYNQNTIIAADGETKITTTIAYKVEQKDFILPNSTIFDYTVYRIWTDSVNYIEISPASFDSTDEKLAIKPIKEK